MAKKYRDVEKLMLYMVRNMIRSIEFRKSQALDSIRRQDTQIHYNLIGGVPLDELIKKGPMTKIVYLFATILSTTCRKKELTSP